MFSVDHFFTPTYFAMPKFIQIKSIRNRLHLAFLVPFFVFGMSMMTYGQCEMQDPPTISCETAPLWCLNQLCYHTDNNPFFCCNGFCGPNTAVHTPQFFQFIPIATEVEIHIHVDDCSNGNGLQAALIDACPWDNSNVIACEPGSPPGGTMVLSANGLIVGQSYWILIDGSGGASCNYTFTTVEGVQGFGLIGELGNLTAEPAILPNEPDTIHLQAESEVLNAQGYLWTFSWNTDTIITSDPSLDIFTPCLEDPGLLEVCIQAYNGCDTLNPSSCVTIELLPSMDRIRPTEIFCPEQFPFTWQGMVIDGPGTYTKSFYVTHWPGQCPYDSVWTVEAYPDFPDGTIDTIVCANQFDYEDNAYTRSGTYVLSYPGQGRNGCDSVAYLNVTIAGIEMYVEMDCVHQPAQFNPRIIFPDTLSETLSYSWSAGQFDSIISTDAILVPDSSGWYALVVSNAFCRDTFASDFLIDSCTGICDFVGPYGCDGDTIQLVVPDSVSLEGLVYWRISPSTGSDFYISGMESSSFVANSTNLYLIYQTIKDSVSTYTCRDEIWVREAPHVSICCDTVSCDTCTILVLSTDLTAGGADVTLWDGMSAIEVNNLFLPDTLIVCPPTGVVTTYSILDVRQQTTGCPGRVIGDSSISVLVGLPEVEIEQLVDTLCAQSVSPGTFGWFSCNEDLVLSTSACFVPDGSGCYCVILSSVSGCADTVCYDFIISATVPIESTTLSLYPNPTTGEVHVEWPDHIPKPGIWRLYDVIGRQVKHGTLNDPDGTIDLGENNAAGLYLLRLDLKGYGPLTTKVTIL